MKDLIPYLIVAIICFYFGYEFNDRTREKAVLNQSSEDIETSKEINKKNDLLKASNEPARMVIKNEKNICLDNQYSNAIKRGMLKAYRNATK